LDCNEGAVHFTFLPTVVIIPSTVGFHVRYSKLRWNVAMTSMTVRVPYRPFIYTRIVLDVPSGVGLAYPVVAGGVLGTFVPVLLLSPPQG